MAFLHVVSIKDAAKIFGWHAHARREAQRLLDYAELVHDAQGMIEENLRAYSLDEGLAVLEAMRDGGWRKGSLPQIVCMAVRELHHRPQLSRRAVCKIVGITMAQLEGIVGATPKRTTENFFNVTG